MTGWRHPRLAISLMAVFAPLAAGCGFTPLYATPGLPQDLAAVQVNVSEGRVPYLLREDLDDALGHDKSAAPVWRLDVAVTQTRTPKGLNLQDVAERYEIGLKVSYTLTQVATNKIVHSGQVVSQVSYDEVDAPYAGIAARQDTQERAASDAARRIQIELASWMARHRTS